jgi:predicted cupin superfamily sugar epimerase
MPGDRSKHAYAVVSDVEFTAWEGSIPAHWMRPGEFKEIVQFAAVKVNADFDPVEKFDVLVRPRVNPRLSDYVRAVIHISDADLEARGVPFAEAWRRFMAFAGDLPLIAYGRDDLVLAANLRLAGLDDSLPPYTNVVDWLNENGLALAHEHGCDIGPAAGVPFAGRPHNALDDSLSLAAGIKALMGRGAPSPLAPNRAADEAGRIAAALGLTPHPEGGAFREIFRDGAGANGRAHSTAIYFLLRAGEISQQHRIDAVEVWHFYRGSPLEVFVAEDGKPEVRHVLGPCVEKGEQPAVVVPAHAWQRARPLGAYTLVGCTVAPGFEFSAFELAK